MSAGQLRMRVRALEREETWAPDWVDHEQAGTSTAAARHRQTATIRRAEAEAERDEQKRAAVRQEADDSDALATVLAERAHELDQAADARAKWYAHTAETRAAADRARLEMSQRAADVEPADDAPTAEEWLAGQRADRAVEERGQPVRETSEFVDVAERRERAKREAEVAEVRDDPQGESRHLETAVPDIREETEHEPARDPRDESDWTRVPTAAETAESVDRAGRALKELQTREEHDRAGDAPSREATLRRWHQDDERKAVEPAHVDDDAMALSRV
jgi:hypothetical protein